MPRMRIEFEFETDTDGFDKATALLKYADKLGVPSVPDEPKGPPPKAGKTAAPAPAPKAKPPAAAAKANSKAKPKEPEPTDIMDLNLGDDDEDDDQTGGLGLGDDDPVEEFDGTPEDAKEEALAKLRTMLGNGMKAQVKEVQQIMKVAKFHDVPAAQGYDFLKAVKDVEAKIGKH